MLKLFCPCLWVRCMSDIKKSGKDRVYYCLRMENISMLKSSADHDNKELLLLSGSSYKKVCSSLYSDNEEE